MYGRHIPVPSKCYVPRPPGTGTGCAIFGVPFLEQKIHFRVSFSVRSQMGINSGVSFWKKNSLGYEFNQIVG